MRLDENFSVHQHRMLHVRAVVIFGPIDRLRPPLLSRIRVVRDEMELILTRRLQYELTVVGETKANDRLVVLRRDL